ncbi:MAG TPA: GFA family protein [Gammaproteobacteria bacterium]|nr:GFA family protein [Gammaproteobacteria bacterium]
MALTDEPNEPKGQQVAAKHSGSCLCGEVRYEVEGDFERFYLCHCGHCRKDTGSAHAANLFTSTAQIKWLAGIDKVKQFELPSTRHSKSFCSICGSALPSVQMNGALLVVPAGSLDSRVSTRPNAHIFVASRADWDNALEDIPKMDAYP